MNSNGSGLKNELNIQRLLDLISQKSDEHSLKELYEIYSPGLYRFVESILKNRELAEETVSDVFFKVWAHRSRISHVENFKAYIYTVARNTSLNYLDHQKRERAIRLDDISVDLPIDEVCPESEIISRELKQAIGNAIDHLPERCKLIYRLAKIEQLRYKEIAQILDISVKTVDHQLTIAIKKIGTEIKHFLDANDSPDDFIFLIQLFVPRK
jgi:RNA polymerase sigma-70 factor (ECF subfamily)